jgi:hypothetical protein
VLLRIYCAVGFGGTVGVDPPRRWCASASGAVRAATEVRANSTAPATLNIYRTRGLAARRGSCPRIALQARADECHGDARAVVADRLRAHGSMSGGWP